ncbi:MAG: energy-coupling factor transporter transmembrane component T [Planctomycetia bacterium]|jgi:energy-coupling factor transport system permease protein
MTVYIDRPSLIHSLDPRVKIAWSVAVSILAVILHGPILLGGLFIITLLPWCLIRPPLARLRLLLVLVGITVLGTMLSQGFFYGLKPRTEWLTLLPGLSLCKEGAIYGAVASLRLLSILAAGLLVAFTTYPSDLILAMTKLRVPHSFAFMLTLALRFLPETLEQGRRILIAQQLRGAGGRGFRAALRQFRLLLVPLLAVSLRSAWQVALATEVRAYSARRVPSKDLRFSTADWSVMVAILGLTTAGILVTWWKPIAVIGGNF